MPIPDIVSANWRHSGTDLLVGGIPASSIASRYGTPFFVYDKEVLERRYAALRQALPQRVSISYSVKANPNPTIVSFFLGKKSGLEIASLGELLTALRAGCSPERIVFAGPGKTDRELEAAIREGIGEIHVESRREVERISAIGQRLGVRVRIAIRVNPTEDAQGGAMQMGGKSAPFGVDEEQLDPLLDRIVGDVHLELSGIHLFSGTQILDHHLVSAQWRKGLEIARRVTRHARVPLRTVDFGGGLGIPYFPGDRPLDLSALAKDLHAILGAVKNEPNFAQTNFMVEPGRFLVGEAGIYITRVIDVKCSRGKTYVILDGGMNHHLAASGNLGQVIKRNFPIAVLDRIDAPGHETVDVVGPLCTPLDTLGRSVELPRVEVGNLIGIFQSGAYARSASPLGFLSHATPPEVWIDGVRDFLIRRRGSFDDASLELPRLPVTSSKSRRIASEVLQ